MTRDWTLLSTTFVLQQNKRESSNKETTFLSKGYNIKWKDATGSFWKHEQSKCHKDAVQAMVVLSKNTPIVGDMLSVIHIKNKADNRKC